MPQITTSVLPTGGAIALDILTSASGAWSLARATSGAAGLSAWTTIASGFNYYTGHEVVMDVGDGLASPLLPTSQYVYLFTDPSGQAQTGPLMPVAAVDLQQDEMTRIIIRVLQGMFNALVLPAGINKPNVTHAMPLVGFPVMPFVVCYPELVQQNEVPVGVDVAQPDENNLWENHEIVHRVYRVTVYSNNAVEREYLRDAVIACFRSALAFFLNLIGHDLRQRWQAASYQQGAEQKGLLPGFYGCDIMLEFSGVFPISFTTSYGLIKEITVDASTIHVQVPLASG